MAATPSPIFFRKSTLAWESTKRVRVSIDYSKYWSARPRNWLTRGDAAVSSRGGRCISWGLIRGRAVVLAHILRRVLIPHAVSHPLHPLSTWKPLLQTGKTLAPKGLQTQRWGPFHGAAHLQRVPDGQQSVLGVQPSSLAGGAKVVVWTDGTLETSSNNWPLAAVTGDIRVQHLRRGHWVWGGRVAKREWREGMKREVSTVLLLLWNNSENKRLISSA